MFWFLRTAASVTVARTFFNLPPTSQGRFMKLGVILSTGLACLFAGLGTFGSTAAEDNAAALFGALPTFGAASLSATGKYLAFVTPIDGNYNVVISEVDVPGKFQRVAFGQSRITNIQWANDSHLLVRLNTIAKYCLGDGVSQRMRCSDDDELYNQTYIVSVANPGMPIPINRNGHFSPSGGGDEVIDLRVDATHVYMSALEYDIQQFGRRGFWRDRLINVNLENGGSVVVREGREQTAGWLTDAGKVLARIDVLGPNHRDILVPDGNAFRSIASFNSPDAPIVTGLTEDGHSLAVLERPQGGTMGLYPLDLATGMNGSERLDKPGYEVARVLRDDHSLKVIGVDYYDGDFRPYYFSPERQRLQSQIESILPGRIAHLMSTSADGKKVLAYSTSSQGTPALHFVNLAASRIDNVADSYPQLRGMRLADVRQHVYRTKDGVELAGVLTLPAGKDPKNLPLIVVPSDGFSYGLLDFDWFAQYLAHRGYAVFEAGRRPSQGFGELTGAADLEKWVQSTVSDIAGGVDDLVSKEIADPKKICIAAGGGVDGYAALSTLAAQKGKYACAIAFSPITDMVVLLTHQHYGSALAYNNVSSTFARNHDKFPDATLAKFSPAKHADDVSAPVLLLDVDKYAWNDHTLLMRDALQSAKKPVETILMKDEDGSLLRAQSRVALLNAVDKFLAAHIGNEAR
jgi:dipeptidyl aminopeptidase/acylaminoacyl peptidase